MTPADAMASPIKRDCGRRHTAPARRSAPLARNASTKAVQHVHDLAKERGYVERAPPMVALVEAVGVRSLLCIPMLKGGDLIGAIAIYYKEPRPLQEEQIALAKNFASRAVVAIESARRLRALWHELFTGAPTIRLSADQFLFSAGQEGDGCYRVDEGSLKVSVIDPAGDERILAILGPGSVVGELSMIDGAPRSASVLALRDSSLSFISRVKFESFGQLRPDLAGMHNLNEAQKISFEVVSDRRTGKSSADNLQAA
jgi:hypothetical protein